MLLQSSTEPKVMDRWITTCRRAWWQFQACCVWMAGGD